MTYSENYWTSGAAEYECTGWVNQRNVRPFIRRLQNTKFSYQEERNTVPEIVNEFNRDADDCIYGEASRFPQNNFVPIECNEIQEALKQILLSAAYRPPDVSETNKDLTVKSSNHSIERSGSNKGKQSEGNGDKDHNDKDNTSITSVSERVKFEKAMKAFYEGVLSLQKALKGCSLNQSTFELKYNLNWTD